MRILSLFDGISCAREALKRADLPVYKYYSSEIDKYAITISSKNYPNIIKLGDVKCINKGNLADGGGIDLLIGGPPCQDLSIAKRGREGLRGTRSSLFYEYARLLKEVQPTYFIMENVFSMPTEAKEEISNILSVSPIMIDARLVSAQQRKRLFWSNIKVASLPKDRGIKVQDCLENNDTAINLKQPCIDANYWKGISNRKGSQSYGRAAAITAHGNRRLLSTIECERLQGLPDKYTEGISNSQRYKCLGNAFNVDVLAHILSFIPKKEVFYREENNQKYALDYVCGAYYLKMNNTYTKRFSCRDEKIVECFNREVEDIIV